MIPAVLTLIDWRSVLPGWLAQCAPASRFFEDRERSATTRQVSAHSCRCNQAFLGPVEPRANPIRRYVNSERANLVLAVANLGQFFGLRNFSRN